MQLRADIWVSAYIRRVELEGAFATLRRRGAAEAGAIYIVLDRLDGRLAVYAAAPSVEGERRFLRAHKEDWIDAPQAQAQLERAQRYDPDMWIVDVESRNGENWLDLA